MTIHPDLGCRTCQIGGAAVDFKCIQCSVRFLGRLPNRNLVIGHMLSIRRMNVETPGFADALDEEWGKFVEQRRKGQERG